MVEQLRGNTEVTEANKAKVMRLFSLVQSLEWMEESANITQGMTQNAANVMGSVPLALIFWDLAGQYEPLVVPPTVVSRAMCELERSWPSLAIVRPSWMSTRFKPAEEAKAQFDAVVAHAKNNTGGTKLIQLANGICAYADKL